MPQQAIEYWKNTCRLLSSIGKPRHSDNPKIIELLIQDDDIHYHYECRLIAQFLLLDKLAESHMLDKDSVLLFAETTLDYSDQAPLEKLSETAQEYYKNWLAYYKSLLDHSELDLSVQQYFGIADDSE